MAVELPLIAQGRVARRADIEENGRTVTLRAIPVIRNDERIGGIVLTRDVSDLRQQEQELITKDATIREIHHRVKNNLQTVASLLRVQARRARSEEAKELFGRILQRRNSFGLLSEDADLKTGELWGNFPQTYSHVGLINCAMRLSRDWEEAF